MNAWNAVIALKIIGLSSKVGCHKQRERGALLALIDLTCP